jgi:two-component sensor histidine kinase
VALIPLRTGGETFGLIQFNDRSAGRFSLDRIALLERLTTHVAIAMHQRQTQRTLQRELSRAEALLQEVHHRVKNNLQIIASLLSLQERKLGHSQADPFREARSRVVAMAAVHQQLYESRDFVAVDMGSYLQRLVRLLYQSLARDDVTVRVQADCTLDIDSAMRCGLIANELISNAAKHAFPDRPGTVTVTIEQADPQRYRLAVRDDGVGFTEGEPGNEGLGLHIVRLLAEQMDGQVHFVSHEGSLVEVCFGSRSTDRDDE